MEKLTTKYEKRISELLEQVREFKTQIYQYKNLLEDKDYHITLLYNENLELKAQIQNMKQPATPSPKYTPPTHSSPRLSQVGQLTPIPPKPIPAATVPKPKTTTMKRQCPNCGASGFAIKEIDDKTQLISYIPRRIYAKIKHCTKCGYEFKL